MIIMHFIAVMLSVFILTGVLVGISLLWLKRLALDLPGARSNHTEPTPTGAGIALMIPVVAFLLITGMKSGVLWAVMLLTAISFFDDIKSLPPRWRLAVQLLAIVLAYPALHGGTIFGSLLPWWAEVPIVVAFWLWFTNLFNFMDGIDGITGMETISIGMGLIIVSIAVGGLPYGTAIDGAILAAAAGAFLIFNWRPAKVFLGDAGSIPLGFLFGLLLLKTATAGYIAAAMILPAYYVLDATSTLISRWKRGENLLTAHSEHAYQQAVRAGLAHDEVVLWIGRLNIGLVALAGLSVIHWSVAVLAVIAAYSLAATLILHFRKKATGHAA